MQAHTEVEVKRLELLADDGQLQAVVDSWEMLPDAMRTGIAAMVASCQTRGENLGVLKTNNDDDLAAEFVR